ncbi:MAG: phage antirepressor [Bacteroidaceae bacterium]|nr:phage antirepressor [Bacteroidaceae bacterium]
MKQTNSQNPMGIQVFKNEMFGQIRTMTNEQGETFFIGKDVAKALGYTNSRKALHDHVDEEDKGVTKRYTLGGSQQMTIINESGLYALILSSQLPQAKAFKRWVTSEVLPQIRRTGRYELTSAELKQLASSAEYAEEVLLSVDCLTTTQVAKEMGMTGSELYRWLVALQIAYWQSGQYMLYADYARAGLAKSRTHCRRNRMGLVRTETYLVWTEEGRKFLHEVFGQAIVKS